MPKITHEEYWKARTDEILRYVDKTDLDIYKELIKLYTEAATDIQKELYAFVLKYAEENNLTYREALKQLRGTDLSDYRDNAKRYFEESKKNPELLKRLNEQYVSSKVTRMDAMNLEVEYRLGVLKQTVKGTFEDYLKKTALYAYAKIGRGLNSSSLNEKVLTKLIQTPFNGSNYAESVGLNVDELAKSIKEVLKVGFIKGSHPRVMAQELMKKVNISRSRAQTIIRTDGTMVINNSIAQRYIDAGLKHYRILVHMDDRTTKICRKHHKENKVYDLKDFKAGITAPPFHYNCRSAIIPDKDELNEDIELNILDGSDENIKLMKGLNTYDDPLREVIGAANISHPKETKLLINELEDIGVNVRFNNTGAMNYQPSPRIGQPGIISIDKEASYSALLHEYTHAMDDYLSNWKGTRLVWDKDEHWRFEERAYNAEIEFCKLNNIEESYIIRLRELMNNEKKRIYGGG